MKEYKEVIFYCLWHNGDLFFSREFVKTLMKIIPAKKFSYAHKNNIRSFIDIPNLEYTKVTDKMKIDKGLFIEDNILYINTHNHGKYLCTVDSLYNMYNLFLNKLELGKLPGTVINYIPEVDYTKFEIQNVDKFISDHPEEKILICNGDVLSGQAANFDFLPVVKKLIKIYPSRIFIITKDFDVKLPNVFFTGDITRTSDNFDLYEISYLSTFCKVIVGRYSGPHTCSQVKQNWFDPNKRLVTFTYQGSNNTVTINSNVKMKKYWSSHSDEKRVVSKIAEAIEK